MSQHVSPAEHQLGGLGPKNALGSDYTFARFWRCALQVNPFTYQQKYRGQAHCVDEDAYNHALVQACLELDIQVVGLADHGNVDSVDRIREMLQARGIIVFPGFEIASTEKIHMVCLFSEDTTKDQLHRYLGKLGLTDVEDGIRPSNLGCVDLAKTIYELGGFWYAAHVTHSSGILRLNKDGGGLKHIWNESCHVRVAQIPGPVNDLPDKFRDIVANKNPEYRRDRPIVPINARDVSDPADLEHASATFWVKMTRPSFEAFKIAFLDPDARVRISLANEPHSGLELMRVYGGYLGGVEARFSAHLNALIGGRGTGKSTFIEFLRYVLELSPRGTQALRTHQSIVKNNLGAEAGTIVLKIQSAAHHGQSYTISRRFGEPPIVRDASDKVSQLTPNDLLPNIEIYGQNEIFELAQDTSSRLRLLERFLSNNHTRADPRETIRKKLAGNAQRLTKTRTDLDELSERVERLPNLGEQLKVFKDLGIEGKLTNTPLFERERQLVKRLDQEFERLDMETTALRDNLPDLTFLSDKALEGLPNASLLAAMRGPLSHLKEKADEHQIAIRAVVQACKVNLKQHTSAWQVAMASGERDLEEALESLPDMAKKSGREVGVAYRDLTQEIERIKPLEAKKNTLIQLLTSLKQERDNLIADLTDLRRDHATKVHRMVISLNQRLNGQLRVRLRAEGEHRKLRDFLLACKLEGVGEKRLAWIEERDVKPLALARAIEEGGAQLTSTYGATSVVAEALMKMPYSKVLELGSIELEDSVTFELNIEHGGTAHYKDLAQLSTGQKCTAVLHLLLLDNPDPLIVDQPEDNLDNAFIADRIVRELRDAKTRRQFLFSTHNANIPVFGDAEWIGVLTGSESRGMMEIGHQGSIDVAYIRKQAAEILEGGRTAFTQRKEMYEF